MSTAKLIRILTLFILLCWQGGLQAQNDSQIVLPKGIMELDGRPAPELVLNDIDGNQYDLKAARGKWVFVHFWASWCGPCRREMPTIQSMFPKFKAEELQIIVINTAESEDIVFGFLGIVAPDLTPLMDNDGLVTERWQPRGLPATFFVDPNGRLRYLALGGRPWDKDEYIGFIRKMIQRK